MSSSERNIEEKLWCLKRKIWAYTIFGLQGLILIIMLGAFGTGKWVSQGTDILVWKGGLLRVTDGPDEWVEVEYKDMQASCNNLMVPCDVFKRLKDAGAAFCFFDVIAYVVTLIWMTKTAFMIMQRPFLDKINCLIWPGVGLFCHILAEIIWSGITKASFTDSCSDITSTNLCSTQGPAAVLATTIFYIITFTIFLIFYLKRLYTQDKDDTAKLDFNPS